MNDISSVNECLPNLASPDLWLLLNRAVRNLLVQEDYSYINWITLSCLSTNHWWRLILWTFQKSIIDVSLCITQYKIFDKKTSVEDRTQLTTTAKSCIADGQLKTLLSTIHQTPIIFYLSCLFFEWEIHEDGNGATTKKGDKDMSKVYIQTK